MEAGEPSRQCAIVAMSYLLGDREDVFRELSLLPEARRLANALGHPEQARRVATLAREVGRIAVALEKGALP